MLPSTKAAAATVTAMKKSAEKPAWPRPEEAGSKKTKKTKEEKEKEKAPVKLEKVEIEWREKLEEGIASAMEALMTVSDLPPEEHEEPAEEARPLLAASAESITPHAALASMLADVPATAAIPEDDDDSDASTDDSIETPKKKKNKDRLSAENKNKLDKARDGGEANKTRRPSEASSKKSYSSLPKNSAATRRMRVTRQSGGDGGAAEPTVLALAHALIVETIVGETPGTMPTEKAAAVNVPIIEKVKEKVVDKVLGELADEIEVVTSVSTEVPTPPPTSVTPKRSRPTSHSTPPAGQSPNEKKENVAPPRRPSATIKREPGAGAGVQTIKPAAIATAKLAPRANVPKSTTAHKQKSPHRSLSTAERD